MIYVLSGWRQIFELLKANCGRVSHRDRLTRYFLMGLIPCSENNRLSPCLGFFSELKKLVLRHFERSHGFSQTVR